MNVDQCIDDSQNESTTSGADKNPKPGQAIRTLFPVYENNAELAYLDSAASAQKPKVVIDAMQDMLSYHYANIHRGAYKLSSEATDLFHNARQTVAQFIGAKDSRSIIFVRGATEGINLVAHCLKSELSADDTVITTVLEHHSNFVPWQMLCNDIGCTLEYVQIDKSANLDLDQLRSLLSQHSSKFLAITGLSNAFGTTLDLKPLIEEAHKNGVRVLVDAAQLSAHYKIDVEELDADFLVFSGHKLYGPTGIGVLYGKYYHLDAFPPFQGGGDMIQQVAVSGSTWAEPPRKFEAGTPAIVEAVGLAAAIDFMNSIGLSEIAAHEHVLFDYGCSLLESEPGVTLYGAAASKSPSCVLPFTVDGVHPHDMASIADSFNVQIRAGHHCAMPALSAVGVPSTSRASLGVYNDKRDLDMLIQAIQQAKKIFG